VKPLAAMAAVAVHWAAATAVADPCVEFLEQHLEDASWEQKCIE